MTKEKAKIALATGVLLSALGLSACVMEPAPRGGPPPPPPPPQQSVVYVQKPPPQEIVEEVPPPPGPREAWAWQKGHWRWNGHDYQWTRGHWVERPQNVREWVPPHWENRGPNGYLFIEGTWR